MDRKIAGFVNKTLSTGVSPLAYLVALYGLIWGLAFTVFSQESTVTTTVLYQQKALFGILSWGFLVLSSSVGLLFGLARESEITTKISAMILAASWASASVVYAMEGEFVLRLPLALIAMFMYGYLYLAASCDRLWINRPNRK